MKQLVIYSLTSQQFHKAGDDCGFSPFGGATLTAGEIVLAKILA